jgi:alkylation response protein AidB-like acyl-CoA dehydrogenase
MSTVATDFAAEVGESARAVFERETPRDETLQRLRSETLTRGVWRAAAHAGWFRLLTAEAAGGLEAGPAEVAALFREIGRYLPSGPFAEAVVIGGLLRSAADLGPDESVIAFGSLTGSAAASGVSGTVDSVEHALAADLLLLQVDGEGDAAVLAVDPRSPAVEVLPLSSFDLVGQPSRLVLKDAPFQAVARGEEARLLLKRAALLDDVARSATLEGIARELLEMSVEYAKNRVQFDRPIGSFQAVQHRLAEMAVTAAAVQSTVDAVIAAADWGAAAEASALCALAAELAREVAYSALQVHGGIGFTIEHRLHAYLKRALRLQALVDQGDPLARLGERLVRSG